MWLFKEKEDPHFDLLQLLYFNSTCEFQNDNFRDLSQLLTEWETISDLNPMFDHVIKMCKFLGTPMKKIWPDFVILLLVM